MSQFVAKIGRPPRNAELLHFHFGVPVFVEDAFRVGVSHSDKWLSCSFALPRDWSRIHLKPRSVTNVDMW